MMHWGAVRKFLPTGASIVFGLWSAATFFPIVFLIGMSGMLDVNERNHPDYSLYLTIAFVFAVICFIPAWLTQIKSKLIVKYALFAIFGMAFAAMGISTGRSSIFPYVHQVYFAGGTLVLILMLIVFLSENIFSPAIYLKYIVLFVPPAVIIPIWSIANIWIVEYGASLAADGRPYCIMAPTKQFGGYQAVKSAMRLSGLNLVTLPSSGGGDDLSWTFHALLRAKDKVSNQYYNWSYDAQRFEPLDDDHLNRFGFRNEIERACLLKEAGSCCL